MRFSSGISWCYVFSTVRISSCFGVADSSSRHILQLYRFRSLLPRRHAGCYHEGRLGHAGHNEDNCRRVAQFRRQHIYWSGIRLKNIIFTILHK